MISVHEKHYLLEAMRKATAILEKIPDKPSCGTCEHFQQGCVLSGGAMPPQEVQAVGCKSWAYNWIPF